MLEFGASAPASGVRRPGYALPSDKLLNAVILRVSDVEVAGGVQRHAPWVAEPARSHARTANDLERLIIRIEDLDSAVAEFANILSTRLINTNIVGITQFAFARAGLAVRPDELTVAGKDLNAMIARVGHINPILSIDAKSFRPIKLTRAGAGAAE